MPRTTAELFDTADSVVVNIKNLSVIIKRTDEGVIADVYPRDHVEDGDRLLAGTWACFTEGEED